MKFNLVFYRRYEQSSIPLGRLCRSQYTSIDCDSIKDVYSRLDSLCSNEIRQSIYGDPEFVRISWKDPAVDRNCERLISLL